MWRRSDLQRRRRKAREPRRNGVVRRPLPRVSAVVSGVQDAPGHRHFRSPSVPAPAGARCRKSLRPGKLPGQYRDWRRRSPGGIPRVAICLNPESPAVRSYGSHNPRSHPSAPRSPGSIASMHSPSAPAWQAPTACLPLTPAWPRRRFRSWAAPPPAAASPRVSGRRYLCPPAGPNPSRR